MPTLQGRHAPPPPTTAHHHSPDAPTGRQDGAADAVRRSTALRAAGALTDAYNWAHYAHRLNRHLAVDDPPRMRTAALLAPLAAQTGEPHLAVAVYRDLITATTRTLGDDHAETLRVRAALAHLRHTLGDCDTGLRDLAAVHAAARHRYGHPSRLALRALTGLGGLYRDCGHHDLANRCLTSAHVGVARYLPPGDALSTAVAAAIAAPPSLNHPAVCTQRRPQHGTER
ncbi:hypothetical protein [Micromonospora rubida]